MPAHLSTVPPRPIQPQQPAQAQPKLRPDQRPTGNGHKHPRQDSVLKRQRIEHIKVLMGRLEWNTRVRRQLGELWGKGDDCMKDMAAVASREVFEDVADPSTITISAGVVLQQRVTQPERYGVSHRMLDRFINTWMKMGGVGQQGEPTQVAAQLSVNQMFQVVQPAEGAQPERVTTPALRAMFGGIQKQPELAHVQTVDREVEPTK